MNWSICIKAKSKLTAVWAREPVSLCDYRCMGGTMIKLLLIDDDEELCAELGQVLEAEGFKVDIAFDGQQGLAVFTGKAVSYHYPGFEITGDQRVWRP